MSLKLYGSLTSPYVRRCRIFLEGLDYQLKPIVVFNDASRAELAAITPIRKLPVLVDGDITIFDSHIICEYLGQKKELPNPSIQQHNLISVIDAATDSMIILFIGKNSGLEVTPEKLLFKLQLERIPDSVRWLNRQAEQGAFDEWHAATIALVSLLEWAEFRGLYDFGEYTALLDVKNRHKERDIVCATRPE